MMDREEAIKQLNAWAMRGDTVPVVAIHMAIESLSAEPTDLISRADAIEAIWTSITRTSATNKINALPSADRPSGEWEERDIIDDKEIEEWQEARCSVCGKWHTTPYMYYFEEYNYCPNCGAKMGGKL